MWTLFPYTTLFRSIHCKPGMTVEVMKEGRALRGTLTELPFI
jgi:hypothetical protein